MVHIASRVSLGILSRKRRVVGPERMLVVRKMQRRTTVILQGWVELTLGWTLQGNHRFYLINVLQRSFFSSELQRQKKVVSHSKKKRERAETDSDLQSDQGSEMSEQELSTDG